MQAIKRQRLGRAINRGQKANVHSVPAPVGGWNARDSLDQMAEDDAIKLDNLFPGFGKVSLRPGTSEYADDLGGKVRTLAEFNAGATRQFLAAANGNIWDITTAATPVSLGSGFSSDSWQWAQFDTAAGGARMGFVNGTDAPQVYDGSTLTSMTVSGTGLTVANLIGINIFKGRSYFWTGQDQDFWYSATNALGGALTKFPLGRVSGFGGNLVTMGTWTVDGGDGVDDLAVFLMSSGDVVIYAGDDPGDANAWTLVGIFRIGAPVGIRGLSKIGSELLVITREGYVPLSQVLKLGQMADRAKVSNKIQGAVSDAVASYGTNSAWQVIFYPRHSLGPMALINVPVGTDVFQQHVVNTQTGAWCRYTDLLSYCWGIYDNRLYFGGNGSVYLYDDGQSDDGASITFDAITAWTYLKARGKLKRLAMLSILGQAEGPIPYTLSVGANFRGQSVTAVAEILSGGGGTGGAWDTSDWDTTDWPQEQNTFDDWHSAGTEGQNFAVRLQGESSVYAFDWFGTRYLYEPGGPI